MVKIIFLHILIFFFGCYLIVSYYYARGLPYYDSVGSYWNMFSFMNVTQKEGFLAGLQQASGFSLSWLQSFFAVIAALILPKTPQALMTLNFLCLFISQLAIFSCVRAANFSREKSYLLTLMPLIPGSLIGWQGGYIDMRRDANMFSLLCASYFFAWVYLWKRTLLYALILGVVMGFTTWSRGNALPYLLIIVGSAFSVALLERRKNLQPMQAVSLIIKPLIFFCIVAFPFYWYNFQTIMTKYFYGSWALGESFQSIVVNLGMVLIFLPLGLSKIGAPITAVALLLGTLIFFLTLKYKMIAIKFETKKNKKSFDLLIGGILIIFSSIIFNSLVLRVGKLGGIIPFSPLLIGVFGILCWLMTNIYLKNRLFRSSLYRAVGLISLTIAILLLNLARIYFSMPSYDQELHKEAIKVALDLERPLGDKKVAFLWTKHINVHDLNFYITQNGGFPISAGSGLAPGVDIEMPPILNKSVEQQQEEFVNALKRQEYIVVSEDTSLYDNPNELFFLFKYGKPVIDNLLADKNYTAIYRYSVQTIPFVVLQKI